MWYTRSYTIRDTLAAMRYVIYVQTYATRYTFSHSHMPRGILAAIRDLIYCIRDILAAMRYVIYSHMLRDILESFAT